MNRTLLGSFLVAALVSATAARADDRGRPDLRHHDAVPVVAPRPLPPPHRPSPGRYELRTVQRWVPAVSTQVWVEGQCRSPREVRRWGRGHGGWNRCTPGHYETVTTPGHYEARQEWVWVEARPGVRYGVRSGERWGAGGLRAGFEVSMR